MASDINFDFRKTPGEFILRSNDFGEMDLRELPDYYPYVTRLELAFNYNRFESWMSSRWTYSFPMAAAYLLIIWIGTKVMEGRKPYSLRLSMFFWNFFLAVFSAWGALRTVPELVHTLIHYGFRPSVCTSNFYQINRVTGFWYIMFPLSKPLELGDTAFIVLRKQKLIALHYLHHAMTVVISGYSASHDEVSITRWYVTMNYAIHALMYAYYALRTVRIPVPRWVNVVITTLQLSQMFMGVFVALYAGLLLLTGVPCRVEPTYLMSCLGLYVSLALLFGHYFYVTYVRKGGASKKLQ